MARLLITVVVPVRGEAPPGERFLSKLRRPGVTVVVTADATTLDSALEPWRGIGAVVLKSDSPRGARLREAARESAADALLFLHADTRLPAGAAERVLERIDAGAEGGAFLLRFDAPGWPYRFGERMVNARTRRFGWALGDQAHFVRRDVFEELGGYPDWPILEDVDFIRRLARRGKLGIVEATVVTDARRFEARGKARTVAVNWLIWTLFASGVSPHRLARLYRHVR